MKYITVRALCAVALLAAPAIASAHPISTGPHVHEQTVHSRAPQVHLRDAVPHKRG